MNLSNRFKFEELPTVDLVIDAVYEGGKVGNSSIDPICQILKGVGSQGGFRPRNLTPGETPYVVLYTDLNQPEWPDSFDLESGVLTYYGDNRKPGREINQTQPGGNRMLERCFEIIHNRNFERRIIPPFFVFRREGTSRNVIFLGLAVPGIKGASSTEDLVAVWKSSDCRRFQNYRAKFTILDVEKIPRAWIDDLLAGKGYESQHVPGPWREWVDTGKMRPLMAVKSLKHRTVEEQLPSDDDCEMLEQIISSYKDKPTDFEKCACELMILMDGNFKSYDLTRPWRDGGRDATGKYAIGPQEDKLVIDYALEAKCYSRGTKVGVKSTSRLISRIKHREFGVLVTTSAVDSQAYKEIKEDGHPIMVVCGRDIIQILKKNGIKNKDDLIAWLRSIG